jgi:glycosylphosphatidylinositol transamidase
VAGAVLVLVNLLAPTAVLCVGSSYWGLSIREILTEAAFGWDVWRMTTQFVVWFIWWPAWIVGAVVVLGKPKDL